MIKLGEIVEHDGVKLECVDSFSSYKRHICDECFFKGKDPCINNHQKFEYRP